MLRASTSGLLLSEFLTKNFHKISNSPMCATCPAHLILLDFYQDYKSWCIKIMKFIIIQLSLASFCLLFHRSKHSPKHPVLKHSYSTLF
jgi:hypothetical protein